MKSLALIWREEDGVLSYEWVLLVTVLVVGIVSGVAAVRDGVVDELGDAAQAMAALDHSYGIDSPLGLSVDGLEVGGGSDSGFIDDEVYDDCARVSQPPGQVGLLDDNS